MLAKTHGQPASPTKLGKELRVFSERLKKQIDKIIDSPIEAKFGAAEVKNIFMKFGNVDLPTPFIETYPLEVSSDSDDTFTSDDDSLGCSQPVDEGHL